ncbi:hypothetical protein QT196_25940 [Streptomyces sp. P9-2B-2]|uniref:hypothetical protein n=1 Tax=Streptomyces TaxID=1883 RepID=UPI002254660A|nr:MULTISPECIES: hypothetical protein [Streptomyces]MCX4636470.1 hypothetical protein [Streptomyces platensis]WJY40443.1 hypothetical protein QT196_25940 [Streptomyces sp. P9-2B-2]
MVQPIARCLAWVRALLIPRAAGRHRTAAPAPLARPVTIRTVLVLPWSPPPLPGTAPRRHRPAERPLDGDASALVRPYYAAYERQPQPAEVVW